MQLYDLLKQLKKIEPDADYTRRSRLLILGDSPASPVPSSAWHFVMHNLQFGSAVAVMAAVLLLFFGAPSLMRVLNPLQSPALDLSSLQAEAEDVDIQVELAKLSYSESQAVAKAPSPVALRKVSDVIVNNEKDIVSLKQVADAEAAPKADAAPLAAASMEAAPSMKTMGILSMPAAETTTTSTASSTTSTEAITTVQEVVTDDVLKQLSE